MSLAKYPKRQLEEILKEREERVREAREQAERVRVDRDRWREGYAKRQSKVVTPVLTDVAAQFRSHGHRTCVTERIEKDTNSSVELLLHPSRRDRAYSLTVTCTVARKIRAYMRRLPEGEHLLGEIELVELNAAWVEKMALTFATKVLT